MLGLLASLVLVGCATSCPSVDALQELIMGHFSDVRGVLEIVEIGEFDEEQKCCPVKANVVVGSTFGRNSIQVGNYCFYETDDGIWAAKRSEEVKTEKPLTQREKVGPNIHVTLNWEDDSSNELGFEIERKTGSGGTYRPIALVGPNITSHTDTGLTEGMTYYYRVHAFNADGYSPYSDEIRFEASYKHKNQSSANAPKSYMPAAR